jgi:hypothetical protein
VNSEIGKIGRALGTIASEPTPLHTQTRRIVRVFAVTGLALSATVVIVYGLMRGPWLDGILAGITLATSMLLEEFPLVLTVFLVMGAWRISRERVLTRRPATIATLGAATVLCTDKTGTLTVNRMSIAELDGHSITRHARDAALPELLHPLFLFEVTKLNRLFGSLRSDQSQSYLQLIHLKVGRREGVQDAAMSRYFTSFALSPDQVALAFPLVRAAVPLVDLRAWQGFIRATTDAPGPATVGALGLRHEGGYICGLIVYRKQQDLRHGMTLVVDLFVALDLVSEAPAANALFHAAEAKARELGCTAVQIRLNAGWQSLAEHARSHGYGTEAQILAKPLEAAPPRH